MKQTVQFKQTSLKAPNSVNASKRKHKNQINHYNKQRRVVMANSTVCQSKWKPIVEPRRAKPKLSSSPNPLVKVLRRDVLQTFRECKMSLWKKKIYAFENPFSVILKI